MPKHPRPEDESDPSPAPKRVQPDPNNGQPASVSDATAQPAARPDSATEGANDAQAQEQLKLEDYEITASMKNEMQREAEGLVPVVDDEVVVAPEEQNEELAGYDVDLLNTVDPESEVEGGEEDGKEEGGPEEVVAVQQNAGSQEVAAEPVIVDVDNAMGAADGSARGDESAALGDATPTAPIVPKPDTPPFFFNPRMWPEGQQDETVRKEMNKKAKEGGKIECLETGIWLDVEKKDRRIGKDSVWYEMRTRLEGDVLEKFDDLQSLKQCTSTQHDSTDFLKACTRLGRLVTPERLAVLLGGGRRNADFCRFLLTGFLNLNNVRKARELAEARAIEQGDEKPPRGYSVSDVGNGEANKEGEAKAAGEENGGSDYEVDDDENVESWNFGGVLVRLDRQATKMCSSIPGEEEDAVADEQTTAEIEKLVFENKEEDLFARTESYVLRNYLMNMSGGRANSLVSYVKYCLGIGMSFGKDAKDGIKAVEHRNQFKRPRGRVKWATEPMPAPEMGGDKTITSGPLQSWKFAVRYFSAKNIARCSLIQQDRLLDWLGFVSTQSAQTKDADEFFKDRFPVVAIAPIPTLYLADLAAEFALKVLRAAAHLAVVEPMEDEPGNGRIVISEDDVIMAAGWVIGPQEKHRAAYHLFAEPATSFEGAPIPNSWAHLRKRPLTPGEEVVLCDRAPTCKFSVASNILQEGKEQVMSLSVHNYHFLYAQHRAITNRFSTRKRPPKPKSKEGGVEVTDESDLNPAASENANDGQDLSTKGTKGAGEGPDPSHTAGQAAQQPPEEQSNKEKVADNGNMEIEAPLPQNDEELFKTGDSIADQVAREMRAQRSAKKPNDEGNKEAEARAVWESAAVQDDIGKFLNDTKQSELRPSLSLCYHRLGWICLHALGQDVESKSPDGHHLLSYGSTANYTNFAQFGRGDLVTLDRGGLDALIQFTDQIVRQEAEILMACATHDEGRPWIDRADVILVHSVRKKEYRYGTITTQTGSDRT